MSPKTPDKESGKTSNPGGLSRKKQLELAQENIRRIAEKNRQARSILASGFNTEKTYLEITEEENPPDSDVTDASSDDNPESANESPDVTEFPAVDTGLKSADTDVLSAPDHLTTDLEITNEVKVPESDPVPGQPVDQQNTDTENEYGKGIVSLYDKECPGKQTTDTKNVTNDKDGIPFPPSGVSDYSGKTGRETENESVLRTSTQKMNSFSAPKETFYPNGKETEDRTPVKDTRLIFPDEDEIPASSTIRFDRGERPKRESVWEKFELSPQGLAYEILKATKDASSVATAILLWDFLGHKNGIVNIVRFSAQTFRDHRTVTKNLNDLSNSEVLSIITSAGKKYVSFNMEIFGRNYDIEGIQKTDSFSAQDFGKEQEGSSFSLSLKEPITTPDGKAKNVHVLSDAEKYDFSLSPEAESGKRRDRTFMPEEIRIRTEKREERAMKARFFLASLREGRNPEEFQQSVVSKWVEFAKAHGVLFAVALLLDILPKAKTSVNGYVMKLLSTDCVPSQKSLNAVQSFGTILEILPKRIGEDITTRQWIEIVAKVGITPPNPPEIDACIRLQKGILDRIISFASE